MKFQIRSDQFMAVHNNLKESFPKKETCE